MASQASARFSISMASKFRPISCRKLAKSRNPNLTNTLPVFGSLSTICTKRGRATNRFKYGYDPKPFGDTLSCAATICRRRTTVHAHFGAKGEGPGNKTFRSALGAEFLATSSWAQSNHTEAERLTRRILNIEEQEFGPNSLSVALSLSKLAELCARQLKNAEAEQLFKLPDLQQTGKQRLSLHIL